jgi:hypothetical protein
MIKKRRSDKKAKVNAEDKKQVTGFKKRESMTRSEPIVPETVRIAIVFTIYPSHLKN